MSIEEKYKNLGDVTIITEGWEQYLFLHEGEWVQFGAYPEEGDNVPTVEGREKAGKLLANLYARLKPFEIEIDQDFEALRNDLRYSRWLESAYYICKEYHKQKEIGEMIGGNSLLMSQFVIPTNDKTDFLYLFRNNEKKAQEFLKDLVLLKREKEKDNKKLSAKDVISIYEKHKGRGSSEGANMSALCRTIGKQGLCIYTGGGSTLRKYFPIKTSK